MKCIVHNCQNTDKQGDGVYLATTDKSSREGKKAGWREWRESGWICKPCFNFIKKGADKNSQVFRNSEHSRTYQRYRKRLL